MKKNELKEIRNKDQKELHKLLRENQEKLRELRFSINANQLKDVKAVNKVRKLIARLQTYLKEKKK